MPGLRVSPLDTPECGEYTFCRSGKTNLCQAIRTTQGQGLMPDGSSRFSKNGRMLHHSMGTSTFSEYTVQPGSTLAVFGLGGIGLAVVIGAVMAGAARIIGIDVNPETFAITRQLGASDCINPPDHDAPIQQGIIDLTNGGVDDSFECIGNVEVMRAAL